MYPDYVLDIFTRDGKVYALPKGFTPIVMLYNKQMFREHGVTEPQRGWTWAEFVQSARALTQDRDGDGEIDVYGVASPTWVGYTIPLMWAYGADFLSPDGTTAMGYTNGPATMDFFQDLQALQTRGALPWPRRLRSHALSPQGRHGLERPLGHVQPAKPARQRRV